MFYLKYVIDSDGAFQANFSDGLITNSKVIARFFEVMDQEGASLTEMRTQVRILKSTNPEYPWEEIDQIAEAFRSTDE